MTMARPDRPSEPRQPLTKSRRQLTARNSITRLGETAMDKKDKKRMEVLQQKIAKLQQLLAGAKKQPDDPAEVPRLEKELAAAHTELAALKKA
jgi:hypothetical protein